MSSESDDQDEGHSDPASDNSDENCIVGSPEVWHAPGNMSRTMQQKMEEFNKEYSQSKGGNSSINADFVTSFSRVSAKAAPPPVPPKSFKRKADSFEKESLSDTNDAEKMKLDDPEENKMFIIHNQTNEGEKPIEQEETFQLYKTSDGESHVQNRISVKDRAKMFEQTQEGKQTPENPFAALKNPSEDFTTKEQTTEPRTEEVVFETNVDNSQEENSSDIYASTKLRESEVQNQEEKQKQAHSIHSQDIPEPEPQPVTITPSPDQWQEQPEPPLKHQDEQQPESVGSSPFQQPEQHNIPESEITTPWPRHHAGQYPAHGWPGTPLPPQGPAMYRQPHLNRPQHQGTPPSGIPRPTYPYRGPSELQHLPPDQFGVGPQLYYPYLHYPQQQPPEGMPPHQFRHEPGPHIEHHPSVDTPQSHHPPTHSPHQHSAGGQRTNTTNQTPKNPKTKQVPSGKGDNAGGQQGGRTSSESAPKKHELTGGNKGKGTPRKEDRDKGPKVDAKKPASASSGEPAKYYVCVDGIDKEQSNDTLFNYLEAKSKKDINYEESLRTEDQAEHAVVVFEDKIDLKALEDACRKRKLGDSSLEFEELDPPRMIIASSLDDKLSESAMKEYLSKKKLDVMRIHATDEGSVTVKFRTTEGVTTIMKETNVKIGRSKVVMSIMFNCEHGTFYDHSLHRVSIPDPFKPSVPDTHIKNFLINIRSTCNEQLERHHARLATTNELHIECTIDPKDRLARQKVKDWKNNVQKAWEEFITKNAQKKELQITQDTKDLLLEHINQSRATVKSETLTVISPDETGNMTFIFVGEVQTVENFHGQISAKKTEIQETLNRKKRMKTETMKLKPIEIALMLKENEFDQLKEIAQDFNYEVDRENGVVTFNAVDDDIAKAKVKIYEVKNRYSSWTIDTLSSNQCKLLSNPTVSDIVNDKLCNDNITAVFNVDQDRVTVCATTQDDCRRIGNVFKETVLEEEIKLDDTSSNVLTLDEWAMKKVNILNLFSDIAINDSANDRILVTATSDIMDEILDDIEKFIIEHSIYKEEMKINEEAEFKFLMDHCRDWIKDLEIKNSNQNLQIQLHQQSVKLSGTKMAIQLASSEINKKKQNINKDKHMISKPGVDSLFSDPAKISNMISPIEEDCRVVITVDENSLKGQPFRKNVTSQGTEEDYVRHRASENYNRRDTKPRKGGQQLKVGPVVCKNGTKITLVKKEDLGQQRADVIICSTNGQLDLSGPAGKSMVKVAGPEIVAEIKLKYQDGIEHGDIAVVKGYKLNCKEVYLAALPGWSAGGEKVISKCVNTCLLQAQGKGYKSIVFPALGTGNLHYPRELVAETMFNCVNKFDSTNSPLKDVKFLCYDQDTITAFEREEKRQMNPGTVFHATPVGASRHGFYKKNNVSVKVVEGDLGQQKVEVLVAAVPKNMDLESAGGAGVSLMKGLGQSIQLDISNQHSNGVASGGFAAVKLSSPAGKCKAVYLTSLDSWDDQKKVAKDEEKQIYKFVYKCLETAEKDGYKSIGIPAMGTGKIGYPHHLVAKYMYDVVEKFATHHKQSNLRDIKFVVHNKDTKSKSAFYGEEKSRLPAPAPAPVQIGHQKFSSGDTSKTSKVEVKSLGSNDFKVGNIDLKVEQGDILAKQCDAIVNGSNEDLDLNKGAVSQAIIKKCNVKKLDAEITKKKDDMKQYGLVTTSGCGLPAGHIIHICSKHNYHEWKKIIKKALSKAEKKQFKSVALPALGTGAVGTDQELMGKTIMEALVEFVAEGNVAHLQQVYLVIFQDKMVQPMLKGLRTGGQTALSGDKNKKVIKSDEKKVSSVTFWIYSISPSDLGNAKQELDKAVSEKYKTEKFHDRLLGELKAKELELLESVGDNYPVLLTFDQRSNHIIIEGTIDNVMSAKQDVVDWMRKFAHVRHCEAEAEIIKEQAQWFLKDKDPQTGAMELIPYPPMINMHLENAYKGDSKRSDVDFKDDQGNDYIIDLKTMTEFPKSNPNDTVDVIRREKLEGEGGTFEPPAEWIDQGTDNVRVVPLINTSPEYQMVEKKFVDSVKNGRYSKHPEVVNKTVVVSKIERIQNLNLYRMYAAKRALMNKQNPNINNEQELWHGTPESAVVSINLYGFNRSYCAVNSQGAWWGQGVYFANEAAYSVRDFLTRPGASSTTQDRHMYLCLVLTGVSRQGVKNEPLRYLPMRSDGTMLPYDSNTDDLKNPLEFVVFNDTQAYPQYLIKFQLK